MTLQETVNEDKLIKSCESCGHVRVCAVFRAISPLLAQSWDEGTRPFEPTSLASICREYVSASALQVLTE